MVDAIGWKAAGPVTRATTASAAPVAAPVAVEAPAAAASSAGAANPLSRTMAASAPVNTDRVAQIKKAIADGKFPILPSTIADRLIALKLEWNPNDKA